MNNKTKVRIEDGRVGYIDGYIIYEDVTYAVVIVGDLIEDRKIKLLTVISEEEYQEALKK